MAKAFTGQAPSKEWVFEWTGKDRQGKEVRGEMRAAGQAQVQVSLRRQGIFMTKAKKRSTRAGRPIKAKDIALFTRQMATMMKAGVPLLQSFDIVGRGNPNPRLNKLLNEIRQDVETGTSLNVAFRKYPQYFDHLYCNIIEAGETAGILENLLDRLATYMEKIEGIKRKIKSALMYPLSVIVVALIVISVIMIFVIPSFQEVFTSFGTDLPAPTLFVMAISAFFVQYWWLIFAVLIGSFYAFMLCWKRSAHMRDVMDRLILKLPIFGPLIDKACITRWSRTLSTMFAAGVPLVEALDSVAGVAGNSLYRDATYRVQHEVSTGSSLATAMGNTRVFPSMVVQMCAIGEESGAVDHMLSKAADFYEQEFDAMVAGLSSLMEPLIIVVLGSIIGGIVLAMYLPVFKLGQVI